MSTFPAMRRVHPEPAVEVDAGELARCYGMPRPRPADRPWVGLCMIASLDGATVVDGRSGALGNAGDRAVFRALRAAADVILVGAATARAEGYGPPAKPGQRIGVVTASGRVDVRTPLFTSGAGFLVTTEDGPPTTVDAVRAGVGSVDLPAALRRLGEVTATPPSFVQAEGGPRLNGAMLDAGCIDELDLTVSPTLAGGDGPRLVVGARPRLAGFDLAHLLVDDEGFVFSRWTRPT